jgi:hypothetical protein
MMKISTLLAATLILSPMAYAESSCEAYSKLTENQRHNIRLSVNRGVGDDLGLTLAAIALTESSAGLQRVNHKSKDYGLYQINIRTAKSITGIEDDHLGYLLAMELTFDDELNAKYALHVLRHFSKVHNGDWSKMIQSYNAGNRYWNGRNYLQKVKENIKLIKQCIN